MKATTFIEAIPGASFAVVLDIEENFAYRDPRDQLKFKVKLDGQPVRGKIIHGQHRRQHKVNGTVETIDGVDTFRAFEFAEHETSMYHANDRSYTC